jgi:transposase
MSMMGRRRRKFTPEYKDEAVRLVINTGRTVATVARELGINEATLGRWVNACKARHGAGDEAGDGAGDGAVGETERAELARLRKEVAGRANGGPRMVVAVGQCLRQAFGVVGVLNLVA